MLRRLSPDTIHNFLSTCINRKKFLLRYLINNFYCAMLILNFRGGMAKCCEVLYFCYSIGGFSWSSCCVFTS